MSNCISAVIMDFNPLMDESLGVFQMWWKCIKRGHSVPEFSSSGSCNYLVEMGYWSAYLCLLQFACLLFVK